MAGDVKQGCMQKQNVVFLGLGLVYLKSLAQVKSHDEEKGTQLSPRVFKSQSADYQICSKRLSNTTQCSKQLISKKVSGRAWI